MLEKILNNLSYSSLKTDKIQATKIPYSDLNTYVYYDQSKQLHFIIESEERVQENRKGIRVRNTVLDIVDHGQSDFIDFICTSEEFKNKFIQIIEEIISLYAANKNLSKSIKLVINKWYYFFEKEDTTEPDENKIKGLIGELIFIQKYLAEKEDSEVIGRWNGPKGGLRDFSFKNCDLEVKTSTKEVGHIHTINGQQQLVVNDLPLYLYSVSLKESQSETALNLKKLIDNISFEIADDPLALNEFYEKLENVNILADKTEKYSRYRYEIKNILTVKITKDNNMGFLIENSNSRISNIRYDLDLNGMGDEKITDL